MKKVGLGLMILGLIGILFSAKPYFSQQRIDEVATYSGEYIQEVVIDSSYAKVEVLPTDHEEIIVELKGYARDKIQDTIDNVVSINEQIGQLAIDISRFRFFNFSLFSFNLIKRLDVIVWLPKKEYKHLKVKNDVGKTTVQNLAVEQLTIENAVANMNIENIIAKAIHVENNVGNITLNNNSGEIFATNDVGNISVRTNEINHHMTFVAKVGK